MSNNLKVLRSFLHNGVHVAAGTVISKAVFDPPSVWQNLANMTPPKVEETDEAVSTKSKKSKESAETDPKLPGL
jgi:hypothetical protein